MPRTWSASGCACALTTLDGLQQTWHSQSSCLPGNFGTHESEDHAHWKGDSFAASCWDSSETPQALGSSGNLVEATRQCRLAGDIRNFDCCTIDLQGLEVTPRTGPQVFVKPGRMLVNPLKGIPFEDCKPITLAEGRWAFARIRKAWQKQQEDPPRSWHGFSRGRRPVAMCGCRNEWWDGWCCYRLWGLERCSNWSKPRGLPDGSEVGGKRVLVENCGYDFLVLMSCSMLVSLRRSDGCWKLCLMGWGVHVLETLSWECVFYSALGPSCNAQFSHRHVYETVFLMMTLLQQHCVMHRKLPGSYVEFVVTDPDLPSFGRHGAITFLNSESQCRNMRTDTNCSAKSMQWPPLELREASSPRARHRWLTTLESSSFHSEGGFAPLLLSASNTCI